MFQITSNHEIVNGIYIYIDITTMLLAVFILEPTFGLYILLIS